MRRLVFLVAAACAVVAGLPTLAAAQSPCEVITIESLTGCHFAFTAQPADAKVDATITTVAGDVTGAPVTVTAQDSEGATDTTFNGNVTLSLNSGPEGAALGGTTTVQAVDGVATFDAFSADTVGAGYSVLASTDDPSFSFDPAFSQTFTIGNEACPPTSACSFTASNTETDFGKTGTITGSINSNGGNGGGVILGTYGDAGIDCPGYVEHTQGTLTFSVTSDELKRVFITVPKVLVKADPDNGIAHYQVCFSDPIGFTDINHQPVPPGGVGLLPKCVLDALGNPTNVPCVFQKSKTGAGVVRIGFYAPKDDPKGRL